ncbi:MAG: ribonuclease H-like domain-containing protein [Blautia sp.]
MIVKKLPISADFPSFETIEKMGEITGFEDNSEPVFYDIETTGLSRKSCFIYLIGAIAREGSGWVLCQWMAEDLAEESKIIHAFFDFIQNCTSLIQYNGSRFDQPFLEARAGQYNITSPLSGLSSLDLYKELKVCRPLLGLSGMKQPDLEIFLRRSPRRFCDGGKCIQLYKAYLYSQGSDLAEIVLGHNREDLIGLGNITSMLGYRALYGGIYTLSASEKGESYSALLSLPTPLPVPVSVETDIFSLEASENEARVTIPVANGKLKQYYADYKNYDYIPAEDTAIPRAISQYMDKSLKKPAVPENCYTCFPCGDDFMKDNGRQLQYLRHTLPCMLSLLK